MSGRQARIARKERQRAGLEVYVHVKPTERQLLPVQILPADPRAAAKNERKSRPNGRELKCRQRLYGEATQETER